MIDVVQQIEAVHRDVTADGSERRTVTLSQSYAASVDEVWNALTDAERIERWFLPVTGDLRLGGRYQLEGHAGGTITACEPPRRFEATWESGGSTSWIAVSVEPDAEAPERTRFRLAHTAVVDDHWAQFGPGAVGVGWDMAVGMGLAVHLASGGARVDRAAVEAWTVSDEGRRFMTLSSHGWSEAHLASGLATPEDATGQEERTTAAYTGV